MSIVADISVVLSWFFEEKQTPQALRILRRIDTNGLLVPPLWWYELENGLLMGERRSRKTEAESTHFLTLVKALPIRTDEAPGPHVCDRVLAIGRQCRLTAYDAAYLELAVREGGTLASFDKGLRRAAHQLGVPLLPAND